MDYRGLNEVKSLLSAAVQDTLELEYGSKQRSRCTSRREYQDVCAQHQTAVPQR